MLLHSCGPLISGAGQRHALLSFLFSSFPSKHCKDRPLEKNRKNWHTLYALGVPAGLHRTYLLVASDHSMRLTKSYAPLITRFLMRSAHKHGHGVGVERNTTASRFQGGHHQTLARSLTALSPSLDSAGSRGRRLTPGESSPAGSHTVCREKRYTPVCQAVGAAVSHLNGGGNWHVELRQRSPEVRELGVVGR